MSQSNTPPLLRDHVNTNDFSNYGTFCDYCMMLIRVYPSPLGPNLDHEITPEECAALGIWKPISEKPAPECTHVLLNGKYGNMDGQWDNAVLPAFWVEECQEFDCVDGAFDEPRQWMEMPWIPEVWEAAKSVEGIGPKERREFLIAKYGTFPTITLEATTTQWHYLVSDGNLEEWLQQRITKFVLGNTPQGALHIPFSEADAKTVQKEADRSGVSVGMVSG